VFVIVTLESSLGAKSTSSASFAPVYLIYVGLFILPLNGCGAR